MSPYQIVRDAIEEYMDKYYGEYNTLYVAECITATGERILLEIDAPNRSYAIKKAKKQLESKAYNSDEFIVRIKR